MMIVVLLEKGIATAIINKKGPLARHEALAWQQFLYIKRVLPLLAKRWQGNRMKIVSR